MLSDLAAHRVKRGRAGIGAVYGFWHCPEAGPYCDLCKVNPHFIPGEADRFAPAILVFVLVDGVVIVSEEVCGAFPACEEQAAPLLLALLQDAGIGA